MHRSEHSPEHSKKIPTKPEYGGCVLVVDDHDALRQLFVLALQTAGFEVIGVATELELQRRLAHTSIPAGTKTWPDVVVLNLQRSELDGLDILSRLRAWPHVHNVPIVFLAGCEDEYLRLQALAAGADWFALLPIGMLELQHRIAELVRDGRARLPGERASRRPTPIRRLKRTG